MICRLCAWIDARFSAGCAAARAALWDRSDNWERASANEGELWEADSEANHALIERATALEHSDPEGWFRLMGEAADGGSAWAMEMIGWRYESGVGVPVDIEQALDHYNRAIAAGSWMATLRYARLLADQGHFDEAEAMLQQGVDSDFAPAFYWMARCRHQRRPTHRTCREVRSLLEYAAERGHPGAQLTLARWRARGRFGLREIPAGWRALLQLADVSAKSPEPSELATVAAE